MRTKILMAVLVVSLTLLGVVLWQAIHPVRESGLPDSSVAGVAQSTPGKSSNLHRQSHDSSRPAAYPRMGITAKFNNDPIKPEEVDRLQAGMEERRELDFFQVQTASKLLRAVDARDDNQLGHVRKNELMNALNRQPNLPGDLVDLYATIYRDPAQNEVIRDYAIQHVYEAYPRLTAGNLQADALSLLREAADESASSTAGTAILALARLAQSNSKLPKDEIATIAFELARNPDANPSARISAFQVIGQLDPRAALPLLIETAQSEELVPLRLSAIGTLGMVGGRGEMALLQAIAEGENARLKPAAVAALKRIQERTGAL